MTADNMVRSIATSVHTLVGTEVDYHNIEPARLAAGLSYLPFIARAVIDALGEYPHLNASVGEDALYVHRAVNLGIAVDLDHQALVVPIVHDAGAKRLPALASAIADLAGRARAKRLTADDLTGGTFTITNVGRYGTGVGHRRAPDRQPVADVRPPGRRRCLCGGVPRASARPRRDPRLAPGALIRCRRTPGSSPPRS
jgi:pyruvate/2-oxoglutarate dehydrogenase complex dihydrolipoamide acyltransferase (E2) component